MSSPSTPESDFLIFGAPAIEQAEIDEVVATMKSGWLGTGPRVARFEEDFKAYKGASHAAAVNSCTAALHLSMAASDIPQGGEVITTPLTFAATANAILHAGGVPVLADVDPLTLNIDPDHVASLITERTHAVLPVHFAGLACDMTKLVALAEAHDIDIIEDCAHAIETTWQGQQAGTFGRFGCFSFYVTKNVVTGEGGMVIARDQEDIQRIKILALHGMSKDAWRRYSDDGYKHYQVVEAGFKYNMMDIQAAIGIHQLARVEANWERRKEIWRQYNTELADLPLQLPVDSPEGSRHGLHLYTVLVEPEFGISRDEFMTGMTRKGIGVGVHYLALPDHPYYQESLGWRPEDTPVATSIGRRTVSLPLSPSMTSQDTSRVVKAVRALHEGR